MQGKTLGCFCKPHPCHGDIIKEYLDRMAGRGEDIEIGTIFYKGKAYPSREITTGMETCLRYRWRSWDMNWKMTCETFWTKLSNRTRISVTIVPTKNYARFPIGKWIRLYTDEQQTDMETPIKVVFRRFKEGGVIALFPYIPWNESENTITSYMHAGQHGAADYKGNHLRDTARDGKRIQEPAGRTEIHRIRQSACIGTGSCKTEVFLIILLKQTG